MNMNDMILVSVDDHVIEPPDTFKNHMPERFKSRVPFLEEIKGASYWNFDGKRLVISGLGAVAGRPREEYGVEACSYSHMRPGYYDIKARVDDMNVNGVLGSMSFPSIMGFAGSLGFMLKEKDDEYAKAVISAYNDWHVHEWAGGAPGRMIPLCLLPMWDLEASVAEAKRLAGLGVHAVSIPDNFAFNKSLPSIHTDHWDPLWKVLADKEIVICCHIGTGVTPPFTTADEPVNAWFSIIPMTTAIPATDWLHSPIWKKFPKMRMALSEAGAGWIPHLLERCDYGYHQHPWTNMDFGGSLPSEVFRKHFIACFVDDKFGVKTRHDVGVDIMTWECDYPHSDSTWPESPEVLWASMEEAKVSKEEIDKITHLNAMSFFNYDPFSVLGRENCTVAALREAGAHVSTEPMRGLGGVKPGRYDHVVTVADLQAATAQQFEDAGIEA